MKRAVFAVLLLGVAVGSCTRVPPIRVLPDSIQSMYIPMFENLSYEPGVEENLTRMAQEEFLADGRLDVVGRRQADVMLVGKLRKFQIQADRLGRDDFPLTSQIYAVCDVVMYDPMDRDREEPLMTWTDIDVEYSYVSDARRVYEISPEDAYELALQLLARQIVLTVMNKRPDEYEELRAAAAEPTPIPPQRRLGKEELDTQLMDTRSTESLSEEP